MEQSLLIYLSVFGSLFTAIVSFYVGRLKVRNQREQFYENKISELLEVQAREIQNLKAEVEKLVKENQDLRIQLEKGTYNHERIVQ